jgi:hypothetical protein
VPKQRALAQKWRAVSLNNKLIVVFSGISMLATVIYSGFAGWQLYEIHTGANDTHTLAVAAKTQAEKMGTMSDAADKMRQAAEGMVKQELRIADNAVKSLAASNRQSKDALDQTLALSHRALEGSIRASRLAERPWVVLSGVRLAKEPEFNKPVTATLTIINTGKTPAIEVIAQSRISMMNSEQQLPLMVQLGPTKSRGMLPPAGQSVPGNFSFTTDPMTAVNVVQIQAYYSGANRLYLDGRVDYGDAFGIKHWTKFCLFHLNGSALDAFSYCQNGNNVDHQDSGNE